ncbi:hypothetical protein CG695_27035, partial [Escherichia coli]
VFAGKKSAQIREILISESAWEEMTCLFAPSLALFVKLMQQLSILPRLSQLCRRESSNFMLDLVHNRGLTLSGTKTHVKRLWLRKTKGSGEDPLVC